VDAYQRYLAEGGREIPPARLTEVAQEIARQRSRHRNFGEGACPAVLLFAVDAREIGRAPLQLRLLLGVGKHTIAASAEGFDSAGTEVTLAGEDRKVVELALARHVESPLAPGPDSARPADGAGSARRGRWDRWGRRVWRADGARWGQPRPATSMGRHARCADKCARAQRKRLQPESKTARHDAHRRDSDWGGGIGGASVVGAVVLGAREQPTQ